MMTEEERYYLSTRDNLLRDIADVAAVKAAATDLGGLSVERVLDVGCGIGQALFPLAVLNDASGVGVDISQRGLELGRQFYAEHLPDARIRFVRAGAESLPFASASFDLVNCGLALPYTRNIKTLSEVSRVLRPGGVFLLKIHHARFYLSELWAGLRSADASSVIHGGRVLAAGAVYHTFRRQPYVRFLNESFQTRWLLARELAKCGMVIEGDQSVTSRLTPAYVIRKPAVK